VGLKENVIIGKLIPAGAGIGNYREVAEQIVPDPEKPDQSEQVCEESELFFEEETLEPASVSEE